MSTQIGTTLKIGFGTNVYTGYIMEDFSTEATAEEAVIRDEDNATTTILISDPGTRITFSSIIKDAGSLTPPAKGDIVTINQVAYRTESASVRQTRGAAILAYTGIKETSMSYT